MDHNIKTWLYDILNAIVEIDSFFDNQPKNLPTIKKTYAQKEQLRGILKLLVKQ